MFLITGATSGIGQELAQILYTANATVWITARSTSKAEATRSTITKAAPQSKGRLEILQVDFNDLRTVKPAVETFLQREHRLDVLWNNAGIMIPPAGSLTEQKFEAQLGVNVLAPFLFTKLLTSTITGTAKETKPSATRVVWISSSAAANFSPKEGGVRMDALQPNNSLGQWQNYGMSKAGAILLASEFAKKYGNGGVLSIVRTLSPLGQPRIVANSPR